jgi:hypothetical protein
MAEEIRGPGVPGNITPGPPLTIQYAPRSLTMHSVTGPELDTVASLSNSIHLAFFGICIGALISLAIVLSLTPIADPKLYASYVALTAVSAGGSIYFGIRALLDYRAAQRKLNEIKSQGVLGQ